MTAYYLDHTDLLESPDEKHTTPCTDRLTKRYIRAVLQDLHDMSHHIYILLENLPEYRFAIVRNYDHVRRIVRPDARFEIDNFTLHQFLTHFDLLHESDGFYVRFYTEMFCYEHGFTPQILEIVYRHYLKYLCKCGFRENRRVYLTEESARELKKCNN